MKEEDKRKLEGSIETTDETLANLENQIDELFADDSHLLAVPNDTKYVLTIGFNEKTDHQHNGRCPEHRRYSSGNIQRQTEQRCCHHSCNSQIKGVLFAAKGTGILQTLHIFVLIAVSVIGTVWSHPDR